jgi:hypothetical protein
MHWIGGGGAEPEDDPSETRICLSAVAEERSQIANLVEGLAQLAAPSLCVGWDIKTVAAHVLSTLDDGPSAFLRLAARRGSLARAIDELAQRHAQLPATEIASRIRRYADRPICPPYSARLTRSPMSWYTAAT